MNDPLFSRKNEVHAPRTGVGSYTGDMPGGRMKWYRLKEGKCPRCAYLLETDEESRFVRCENPHCSFGITAARMRQVIDSLDDRSQEEGFNQSELNNM